MIQSLFVLARYGSLKARFEMNMNNPLISIIIPCYNSSKYLEEAVESIIKQTYENWECIIVDDGSTDNTRELSDNLCKKDGRIKYVYQANSGLAAARNTGYRISKGHYIQFLDADDRIHHNKFEDQLKIFRDNPSIGVCYTNYQTFDSETGNLTGHFSPEKLSDNPLEDLLFKWERGLSIPIHSALFERSIFKIEDIFNTQLKAKEDWHMWVSLALEGVKFYFLDKDYAFYRFHLNNMTRDAVSMLFYMMKAVQVISEILPDKYRNSFIEKSLEHLKFHYIEAIVNNPPLYSTLFVDTGHGFNGSENVRQVLNISGSNDFSITFGIRWSVKIRRFRFDPLENRFCKLKITQVIIETIDGSKMLDFSVLKTQMLTNGRVMDDGYIDFETPDPQILFSLSEDVRQLTIQGEIEVYNPLVQINEILRQKEQLIQSTYTWRVGKFFTWFPEKVVDGLKKLFSKKP